MTNSTTARGDALRQAAGIVTTARADRADWQTPASVQAGAEATYPHLSTVTVERVWLDNLLRLYASPLVTMVEYYRLGRVYHGHTWAYEDEVVAL